ncbi:MAG TPA: T9SS type A sorting domain-containing protein, partial [Bacteroidetes bacterium]|nr:T9SS type A sorting domain-containing protein [Bacteroidota bacterium]HEX04701.1 T9SS type A sorting domain-containing protein [Bacteroidota bacterium]
AEGDNEITIAVSDGDLQTLTTIPVNVLAADARPTAFQPLTPVDGGTAWEGASTSWQLSQHPDGLDITYNFVWATDEEFSDADSVTGLVDLSVELQYADVASVPMPRRDIISIGQSQKRNRDRGDQLAEAISTPVRNARATKSSPIQLSEQDETVPTRSREDRRQNPLQLLDGGDDINDYIDTIINTNILPGTTYYWKVRAVASDNTDRYSPAQSAVAEIPDAPEPFALLEPTLASVVVTTSPTFRWRAAFDPDINDTLSYDLIWSADGGTITDTIFAIPDTLFDMSNEDLDFTGMERFQSWLIDETQRQRTQIQMHSVPVIQPVERPSELGRVQRSGRTKDRVSKNQALQLSDNATQPESRVKRSPDAVLPLSDEQDKLAIDDLVDHATITWFVEVEDATGNRTAASDVFTFTVDAPDLPGGFDALSPADSLFVHNQIDVTLSWTESQDNDPGQEVLYDVLATTDPDIEDITDFPVIATGISETTHVMPSGSQDDLEWRWTVRGISAGDTVWMSEQALHVFVTRNDQPAEFALTYPEDSALIPTTTPTLEWEETEDTDLFDQVTYSLFWTLDDWDSVDSTVGLNSTSYLLDIGLEDDQSVRWNVLAVDLNSEGRWAVGEEGFGFQIYINDPPTPFSLIEPEDGSLIITPTFTLIWQESFDPDEAGPVIYTVEMSDDIEFTEPSLHNAGEDTSLVLQTELIGEGEFWWRVVAEDATQQSTYSTNTWSLQLDYNSVPEWARGIPTEFAIARSYPNPFNPVLTVVVASPKPGAHIAVTMHNILGREVERRTWRPNAAGYKSIDFNMNGHASGAYFVRMHADGQVIQTQRVTYLK